MGWIANQANDGMGIEFTEIGPADQARLEDCLAELAGKEREVGKFSIWHPPPVVPS